MLKYHPHHASLVYISVSHISNPNVWMFGGYPKNVIFNYCNFNSLIDPPLSRTQRMIINGVGRCTKKEIKINLKKFPKLKELRVTSGLRVHDIDGTLLEVERKNLNDCYLKIKWLLRKIKKYIVVFVIILGNLMGILFVINAKIKTISI